MNDGYGPIVRLYRQAAATDSVIDALSDYVEAERDALLVMYHTEDELIALHNAHMVDMKALDDMDISGHGTDVSRGTVVRGTRH